MFRIGPCHSIWLVFIPIHNLSINSALFMQNGPMLQGTYIDAVGPYFLQISDERIYELLFHYLTVISKIFIRAFPTNFILWSSITLSAAQNHIYKESVTSETQSNMALSLQNFSPSHSWLLTATESLKLACHQQTIWTSTQCMGWDYSKWFRRSEFGGLSSLRYLCNRLWQYHCSSYHKDNTFTGEEVRITCLCE